MTSFECAKNSHRHDGLYGLRGFRRVISYHCGVGVCNKYLGVNVLADDYP